MKISGEQLRAVSDSTGFQQEMVEKVIYLINLLNKVRSHPFLKNRFVLKGGTALNLFLFDLPRLSIDIDLNYVGAIDRKEMLAPVLNKTILPLGEKSSNFAKRLVDECREKLEVVFPLSDSENEFLENILEKRKIVPELLTTDKELGMRIRQHPMLNWKALNVRKYFGIQ